MFQGNLGVGIICFDRIHYFQRMLESLCKNTYLHNTDFHLYQDGWHNRFNKQTVANHRDLRQCVNMFESSGLPNKHTHFRSENVGIAINQFEAYEELTKNYEFVLILEDDIVISPHYLRLIRVLIDQFGRNDEVFSVSLNFRRGCDPSVVHQKLHEVSYCKEHWWADCFAADKWQLIKPHFLRYYEIVKNIPYHQRPNDKIFKLFEDMGHPIRVSSQDAAKETACHCAGLKRLNSTVNRGIYIGESGVHFTPDAFRHLGFANQEPYIFAEDEQITEFKMV